VRSIEFEGGSAPICIRQSGSHIPKQPQKENTMSNTQDSQETQARIDQLVKASGSCS
jgi:hypothetical protein